MAESTPRSYKPIWWALVVVGFLALCGWAYVATQRSNHAVQQASASGAGVGAAYDPTTGKLTPAGATPGALGTNGTLPKVDLPPVAANGPSTTQNPAANR